MSLTARLFLILGSVNALLVVLLGAFGAHGLKARIAPEMLALYQTGVLYHFFHALGLMILGFAATRIGDSVTLKWAGWLMFAGIILFSGSLYLMSVTGVRWLGSVTPVGGLAFVAAWGMLVITIVRTHRDKA